MKLLAVLIFGLLVGAQSFAASVCDVQQNQGTTTTNCDGKSTPIAIGDVQDDFTATLNVLVNQGYKIVSSAGGPTWIQAILVK
jgi:hypothetical protein